MVKRIDGLPNVVNHLTFSPDGRRLAATLRRRTACGSTTATGAGPRSPATRTTAIRATAPPSPPDGRLATTSLDGKVRLYAADLQGLVRPTVAIDAPAASDPSASPSARDGSAPGGRLRRQHARSTCSTGTRSPPLPGPDTTGIDNGDLGTVAWSADGATLFAAGSYRRTAAAARSSPGATRARARGAACRPAGHTVMSLRPLPDGDLLVAAADPWLGRLRPDGTAALGATRRRRPTSAISDKLRRSRPTARGSTSAIASGASSRRGSISPTLTPARSTRRLTRDLAPPRQDGLPIEDWDNTTRPTLGGTPLGPRPHTRYRAASPSTPTADRFVLGTDWSLRAFDANGKPLWQPAGAGRRLGGQHHRRRPAGGGRLWRRHDPLAPDERRRGAARLHAAGRPDQLGRLDAGGLLRRHPGRARRAALARQPRLGRSRPKTIPVADIPGFYRPEVLPLVLQEMETPRALGLADHRRAAAQGAAPHQQPRSRPAPSSTCWRSASATTTSSTRSTCA